MNGGANTRVLAVATAAILLTSGIAAQGQCNLLGEVFVTNPFDQILTIKGDGSADINTIRFSNQTRFVQVTVERKPAGEFDPKNLQTGDRLCVQLIPAQAKIADRVLVMKRLEIQQHQKQVFSTLARNSAFGVVTDLNAENRTIRLKEELRGGSWQQITVAASELAVFRHYSPEAQVGQDGVATVWAALKVGDRIYVEGRRGTAVPEIRADVIIEGGVRGIVGTIVSMSGLGEVIELHEVGSGNSLLVQTRRDALFRVSPFVERTIVHESSDNSASWDLYPLSFNDLQKGDTVSVLASEGGEALRNTALGLMVVTGFGSYGINALPPGAPAFWFIDPLKAVR